MVIIKNIVIGRAHRSHDTDFAHIEGCFADMPIASLNGNHTKAIGMGRGGIIKNRVYDLDVFSGLNLAIGHLPRPDQVEGCGTAPTARHTDRFSGAEVAGRVHTQRCLSL